MSILTRLLPNACSRLRIFICYAREDRDLAIDIGHALTNDGHDVFIDANSLKVATDFNEEIRNAIDRADRFIFLASLHSLDKNAYPQTELGFAQQRWPAPKGAVWPVLIDPAIDPAALPPYLRSVHVLTPRGNVVADLAATIESSRRVRPSWIAGTAAAAMLFTAVATITATGGLVPTVYTLHTPQQVDFRPSTKPGPDDNWKASPVALTLIPVSYSNDGNRPLRIVDESVTLSLGETAIEFKWLNEVEIRANCGEDWLCTKTSVGVGTIAPQTTLRRETMYLPIPAAKLEWREFVAWVCRSSADILDVTLSVQARANGLLGSTTATRNTVCRVDLKFERKRLQLKGCQDPSAQLPIRLSPKCLSLGS